MNSLEKQRIKNPLMEYYRHVYHFSKRWDGKDSLEGKTVIVYCEQGYGDIIQFLRYIPQLKAKGCEVILHCPESLHPLLPYAGIDNFFDKNNSKLPKHDYHILSLSLPFLLDVEISSEPYIDFKEKADLSEYEGLKVGIAWEGSPEHPKNYDRCCPLKHFKGLDATLFMLQDKIHLPELVENVDFDIFSIPIKNFKDTATLINAVDFVVTVDTSILHLAGALGKRTYGLLGPDSDPRWEVRNWYDSVTLLKGTWELSIEIIRTCRNDGIHY